MNQIVQESANIVQQYLVGKLILIGLLAVYRHSMWLSRRDPW